MSGSMDVIDKFVSEGVFTTCKKEYLQCVGHRTSLWNQLSTRCLNIVNKSKLCGKKNECFNAKSYCQNLGIYLHHIDEKKEFEKERSCLYFFYKLKDLVNTYKGECKTTVECYEELTKEHTYFGVTGNILGEKISNTCVSFAESNDINVDIFNKLQYLEKLYNFNEKFNQQNNDCNIVESFFKEFYEIFEMSVDVDVNASFRKELENFIKEYSTLNEKYQCQRTTTIDNNIPVKDPESAPEAAAVINVWRYAGTGVGVLTVVLLINMFILYKVKNKFNLLYN